MPVIPRTFHRVVPHPVPDVFDGYWQRFQDLHPDWEFKTWQDPIDPDGFELGGLFDRCNSGAQLADLVRIEVVYRFGGVYVDMDVEPFKAFDDLPDRSFWVAAQGDGQLCNAVFAAEPQHPALRALMDDLIGSWPEGNPTNTGPALFTRILSARPDVMIMPPYYFYPYGWSEKDRAMGPFTGSYAAHRWNHSWAGWDQ